MNKLEVKKDGTYVTSKDNTFFMQEKVNDNYFTKFRTKWDQWIRKIKYLDD